jgi:hypothetical protein
MEYTNKTHQLSHELTSATDLQRAFSTLSAMELELLNPKRWGQHFALLKTSVTSAVCVFLNRVSNHQACNDASNQSMVSVVIHKCVYLLDTYGSSGVKASTYIDAIPPCGGRCVNTHNVMRNLRVSPVPERKRAPRIPAFVNQRVTKLIAECRVNIKTEQ